MTVVAPYHPWPITRPSTRPAAEAWGVGALRAIGARLQLPPTARQSPGGDQTHYDEKGRIVDAQRLGKGFFIDILV